MNLGQQRTAVLTRLGLSSSDAILTTAVLNDLINSANRYVASENDWPWLELSETITTVNGTDTYAVAAAAVRTISLHDATGVPFIKKPITELAMIVGTTATPRFYSTFNASLVIRPTPSAAQALVHRYVAQETVMTADADLPLLQSRWDDALTEYATMLAARRIGNTVAAQQAEQAYNTWITQMIAHSYRDADTEGGGPPPARTAAAKQSAVTP